MQRACDLFEVSRSAFYTWSEHVPSERDLADAQLSEKIIEIHKTSRRTYGAPRIVAEPPAVASA